MKNNKAMMINANQPIRCIQENLPDYIGYDDERRNNFLIIQDMTGASYRKNWWLKSALSSSTGTLTSNQDAIEILANLNTTQAAGIVLEEKDADLAHLSRRYLELSPDKNIKIRILQEPYRNNRVFDFYVHDFNQHDVFFITVNDISESDQMLDLLTHVHDLGKKLVVITENEVKLNKKIDEVLTYSTLQNYQHRLKDRMRNILLRKSDWHEIKPSVLLDKDSENTASISQPNIAIGPQKLTDHRSLSNRTPIGPFQPQLNWATRDAA
jgi:hypothetical protein